MNIAIEASNLLGTNTGVVTYTYYLIKALLEIDKSNHYYIIAHGNYKHRPEDKLLKNLKSNNARILSWQEPWYYRFMLTDTILGRVQGLNKLADIIDWRFSRRIFDQRSANTRQKMFDAISDKAALLHLTEPIEVPDIDIPVLVMIHDITPIRFPDNFNKESVERLNSSIHKFLELGAFFITNSEYTRSDFISYFNVAPHKVRAIPLGVSNDFCPISDKIKISKLRNKLKLKGWQYILYAGRIDWHKNIESIIKSFYCLQKNKKNKDLVLVIAGADVMGYSQIISGLISKLSLGDKVILTGFLSKDDLSILMSEAALFVYVSLYEGFGLPILEAMACGVAVIASNVSSIPEVVADAAILVEPLNVEQLAGAMETVLYNHNLREELKIKSLNRAKELSWKKTALSTLQVYQEILKN